MSHKVWIVDKKGNVFKNGMIMFYANGTTVPRSITIQDMLSALYHYAQWKLHNA